MVGIKSVEENYKDFNRVFPLSGNVGANAGALAAWMDMSAAYCGLPCSEKSSVTFDRLAKVVCETVQAGVTRQDILRDALAMATYPFRSATGVVWAIWRFDFASAVANRDHDHDQMQPISKGQALELARNTEKVLAWRAEIALRHGGNYKLALEQMMEPLNGIGELAEHRLQRNLANEHIRMLTMIRNRPAFRR